MTERALSFGAAAENYERFRLGYPDALVDEVLAYVGHPVRDALEIGAGTGKATRAFAARGIPLTATDPDASMLAELRRHVPANVGIVQSAFEDLPEAEHDLVLCAAALHWTAPEGRWEKVASLLRAGGTFAVFGGSLALSDVRLEAVVREAREPYLPHDDIPRPTPTESGRPRWPATALEQSQLFEGVRTSTVERRVILTAEEYIGHLATVSAYLMLGRHDRELTFAAIANVLPAHVEVVGDLDLTLARAARAADRNALRA